MKIDVLQNRINSLKEKIAKKKSIIEKKNKTIQKKEAELKKAGIDPSAEGFYDKKIGGFTEQSENSYIRLLGGSDDPEKNRLYYIAADNAYSLDDIKQAEKDIQQFENKLKEYEEQLYVSNMKKNEDDILLDKMPIEIKRMESELIAAWDLDDEKFKEEKLKEYEGQGYRGWSDPEWVWASNATKESIHKENVEKARELIIDLIKRTFKVVGEITGWENLKLTTGTRFYPVINGVVHGKDGSARIESVLAGGNIQKLHVRVLVHKIKD